MARDKSRKHNTTSCIALAKGYLPSTISCTLGVTWLLFILPVLATPHAQAEQQIAPQSLEVQARRVDRVALQSQDAAATKLKILIKKYAGKAQEGVLLMRLAQIYQEGAAIEFRIGHGKGAQNIQLIKYKARLVDAVTTINDLLKRFPNYPLVDEALFIRAKAFEELGQKDSAKSDYLTLTRQFSDSKHLLASYMALADLVIEKNNHPEAIQYLAHIEQHPESALFPFALYKMAWSYYNLKNIPTALSYIERHVKLYAKKLQQSTEANGANGAKAQDLSASDLALRENSLMDTATFYFDGYEMGIPTYTLSSALSYFESLHPGEQFGKMTLRFAKLLRSRQREADLITWKNEILRKQPTQLETMDVVMTLFDHLWDQRRLDEIPGVCSNIESLFKLNEKKLETIKSDNYLSARNALTTRAEALQEAILKSGQAANTQALQKQMTVLRSLYTTFIHIVPETDPRILLAHYNLAETLFKTADFQQATENYRWILAHWNKLLQFSHSEIEIKAIASRYEWLHQNHKLPSQITPKLPDQTTWAQLQPKLPQEVREWAEWIDSYSGTKESKGDPETFNNFVFELNRTLYEQGGKLASRPAIERLVRFADRNPSSKFAIPSQELVLDSLMLTQNWPEIGRVANYFMKKAPLGSAFRARLEQLSADTSFKQLEVHYQAKNYDQAQDSARSYIRSFPKNPRVADALFLIANTALAKKNETEAFSVYSEIIQKHPDSSFLPKALTGRAQLSLNSAQWAKAADDFEKILQLKIHPTTAPEYSSTWKQLAFLKWITGQKPLSCSNDLPVQSSELKTECEKYSVLYSLATQGDSSTQAQSSQSMAGSQSKQHALKSSDENRALWALLALSEGSRLTLHERLVMIRTLSSQWEKLDATLKLTTLSQLNQILPQTLESVRLEIKKATPMNRVTAKAVQIRAEWIREFEESIAKLMKLPWYRLQALSLSELAMAYDDFVVSLQNAPVPKDVSQEEALGYQKTVYEIIQPFSQKRDEIAERSIRVASESAVESEIRKTVLGRFPNVTKKIEKDFETKYQKTQETRGNTKLANSSTETGSPGLNLEASLSVYETLLIARKPHPETPVDYIQLWLNAYRTAQKKGNWTQCAYLLQEIAERKVASEVQSKIMHAMTLASMGAQAEALIELQSLVTQKSFQQELASNQVGIAKLLLSQYLQAGALENSILMTQSIEKLTTATLAQNEKGAL